MGTKSRWRWVFAASLLLVCVSLSVSGDDNDRVITLVADEWCPYNCVANSTEEGFVIDIARAVFEPKGYAIHYKSVPWTRAVLKTLSGEYDAAVGATKPELPTAIFPQQSFGYSTNYFVVSVDSMWEFTGVESLKNIRLGVIQDYDYGDDIAAYLAREAGSDNIVIMKGDGIFEQCLRLLVVGRIDACLEDKNVAFYSVKKLGLLGKVMLAGKTDIDQALYIAFSPKNKHSALYAKMFSEGLDALRESGQLKAILARYGLSD